MNNAAGRPPPYGFMRRITNRSLRSVILPLTLIGAIWSISSAVSLFQEQGTDKSQHEKKLATFAIVLGSLYTVVAAMFIFGVVAAATKRLALIRIFSFLSVVVTVIVISTGLLRTIIHFMLKNDLISECTAIVTGQEGVVLWGVWSSNPGETLTPSEAAQFCQNAWSHDSFAEIFWLICELVYMPLLTWIAFAYANQESALAARGVPSRLPANYTPAYDAGTGYAGGAESTVTLPEVRYDQPYAPPPGSPPPFDKSLPRYGSDEMDKKDTDSMKTAVAEDPFADFEEHPRR